MGQPITVQQKPSSHPNVLRFETDRNFTGMGKELYGSPDDIIRDRPPDRLARRFFEHGGVRHVTVYGGVVTVEVDDSAVADELRELIESLYLYYRPGDPPPEVPAATAG